MKTVSAKKSELLSETINAALASSSDEPADCNPKIVRLVEYWFSLCEGESLPVRKDIDPIDIPDLLPSIRLLDIEGDLPRFRVRLTGDKVRNHFGSTNVGDFLDDIVEDFEIRESYANCMMAIAKRRPVWHRGICDLNPDRDFVPLQRVIAPLASDRATVYGIIIVSIYGP
tara:strand:+ start:433 stop:945 length:513 start_codon:yes stop_codon:yes gene_type:complete